MHSKPIHSGWCWQACGGWTAQRYSQNLFLSLLLCATHATRHAASYTLQFIRPVLSRFTVPPQIKGITNDLGCWSSRDFAQLPSKGRPVSNHSTPPNLLSPEYRSKVHRQSARKGFSVSYACLVAPLWLQLCQGLNKPCHAELVLWWGCGL